MPDDAATPANDLDVYDADESYDAGDELADPEDPQGTVEVEVDDWTKAALFAQVLVDLRDAGFPQDPDDLDGSQLTDADLEG